MTEEEARAAAKVLRKSMIGVVADQTEGNWGVRPWARVGSVDIHTDVDLMPSEWQRELARGTS